MKCPFCKANLVFVGTEWDSLDESRSPTYKKYKCVDCGKTYLAEFRLTIVKEVNDE